MVRTLCPCVCRTYVPTRPFWVCGTYRGSTSQGCRLYGNSCRWSLYDFDTSRLLLPRRYSNWGIGGSERSYKWTWTVVSWGPFTQTSTSKRKKKEITFLSLSFLDYDGGLIFIIIYCCNSSGTCQMLREVIGVPTTVN